MPDSPRSPAKNSLSRRNFLRFSGTAGLVTLMGALFPTSEHARRAAPLPLTLLPEPDPAPYPENPHYFHDIHGDPRRAVAIPRNGEIVTLEELLAAPMPRELANPADAQALGGKRHPLILTWNPDTTDEAKLKVDNEHGILSYDMETSDASGIPRHEHRVLMRWPVNTPNGHNWMHDDAGVHLWGGPRAAVDQGKIIESLLPPEVDTTAIPNVEDLTDSLPDQPDTTSAAPIPDTTPLLPAPEGLLPLSVSARRAHPFHYRYVYTPENARPLLSLLKKPEGHFHDLSTPPPAVAETSIAYAAWKYDHAAKGMWNILHWRPEDKAYPKEANYAPLAVSRIESAHNDLPGPDNWEVNNLGYGGWFQPQINRPYKPAMIDAGLADKSGQWLGVVIDGKAVRGRDDYLKDWKAQMVFFWSYLGTIKQTLQEPVKKYRENAECRAQGEERFLPHPEMTRQRGLTYFGACMGGFLTGPSTAVNYMNTGAYERDANGTSTEFYAKYFSPITEDKFVVPQLRLNSETKEFITSYFSPERMYESLSLPGKPAAQDVTARAPQEKTQLSRLVQGDSLSRASLLKKLLGGHGAGK